MNIMNFKVLKMYADEYNMIDDIKLRLNIILRQIIL
jgi:hypothetical protein